MTTPAPPTDISTFLLNSVSNAAIPLAVLNGKNFRLSFANKAFKVLGQGMIEGDSFDATLSSLKQPHLLELLTKSFESGLALHLDSYPIVAQFSGDTELSTRYFDIRCTPFRDETGAIQGVITTWEGIADGEGRSGISRQHSVNAQAYELFMQAPVGFCLAVGDELKMELVNTEFLRLTGRTNAIIGESITDVFPEIGKQGFLDILRHVYSTGKSITIQERQAVILIDGVRATLYITTVLQPFFDDGSVAGILSILTDVTAAVKGRQELEESSERLRLATLATNMGTWEFDMSVGHFILSDECKNILGFEPEDFVDYSIFIERVHPDDQEFVNAVVSEAMESTRKNSYDVEFRVVIPNDPRMKWVRTQAKTFLDADNIPGRFIGTLLDITEEHNRLEKIRINEERLRLAVAAGQLGTYEFELKTETIVFSPRLAEIFGFDPNEKPDHRRLRKSLHPEDVGVRDNAHKVARESGNLFYEARVVWPDGSVHWVRVNGMLTYDKGGEPLRMYGSAVDITEEKEKEKRLRESQKRFALIADAIPHMVWEIQMDGTISYINQQWEEWSGMSLADVQEQGWSNIVHPDDKDRISAGWRNAFEDKKVFTTECRVKNSAKGYTWFAVKIVPVKNETGALDLWIGTATNIHERKLMEQQKDEFISIASHELKTPVTTIKAYNQIAEEKLEKKGDAENLVLVKKMSNQINRLTTLISDLLDISKIQKGKLEYNESAFNIDELVSEVVDDMQKTSLTHEIEFRLSADTDVYGDRNKLSQVIDNLISNAIKYSPNEKRILVETKLFPEAVRISVRDFGIGVAQHERELIFTQFYRVQVDNQFTYPGMGIGLYICSEIVKRFGGHIWVEGSEPSGSSFNVIVPLDHKKAVIEKSELPLYKTSLS